MATTNDVLRRAAFWGLLPLVAPQGLWLRKTAPRFPGARGPGHGSFGAGPPLRLLAIGDSIVAGVGADTLAEAMPGRVAEPLAALLDREVRWHAVGRIGARAPEVRDELLPEAPRDPFDLIVISVGVNDVTAIRRTSRWRVECGMLLDRLRQHSPDALIVLCGLPPLWGFPLLPQPLRFVFGMRAKTFDRIGESLASERPGCTFVATDFDPTPEKFSPDGYHPSAESHRVWGGTLAEVIAPRFLQHA